MMPSAIDMQSIGSRDRVRAMASREETSATVLDLTRHGGMLSDQLEDGDETVVNDKQLPTWTGNYSAISDL
jgi:hypothetical protein